MKEQLLTHLLLAISVVMFVFSALQLTRRDRTRVNLQLSLMVAGSGFLWLNYWLYRSGLLSQMPWLIHSDVAATFLIGPAAFAYTRSLIGNPKRLTFSRQLLYVPAALVFLWVVMFQPGAGVAERDIGFLYPDSQTVPAVFVLNIVSDIWLFCFIVLITRAILLNVNWKEPSARRSCGGLLLFLAVSLLSFVFLFAGHGVQNGALIGAGVLINGVNHVFYFFWSYRHPDYSQAAFAKPRTKKRYVLSGVDVSDTLSRLEHLIEQEKVYRDFDLSLQSLSNRLGIQNHQLTTILNSELHMNFRSFVNRHRIEEARMLLAREKEMPIIDVAFAVGFNSKSSFNAVFMKETGCSPSEFRKGLN